MASKSKKALKTFLEVLKWITVIPGLISLIINKIKEVKQ